MKKALIRSIDDVYKAQVKGFTRTKKGKLERVNPYERVIPGKFRYKTVDLRTEAGIKQAEQLKDKGWKIISHGLDSIQFERPKSERESLAIFSQLALNEHKGEPFSATTKQMEHEVHRMSTMTEPALMTRAKKITDTDKLIRFYAIAEGLNRKQLMGFIKDLGKDKFGLKDSDFEPMSAWQKKKSPLGEAFSGSQMAFPWREPTAEEQEKHKEEKKIERGARVESMESFASELGKIKGVERSALDDYTPSTAEEGTIFINLKISKQGSSSKRNYKKVPWEFEITPASIATEIKRTAKKMGMEVTEIETPKKTYHKTKYDSRAMFDGYNGGSIRVEVIGRTSARDERAEKAKSHKLGEPYKSLKGMTKQEVQALIKEDYEALSDDEKDFYHMLKDEGEYDHFGAIRKIQDWKAMPKHRDIEDLKYQEAVGKSGVVTIDDLYKAHVQVKGHLRTRKGKLERVKPYSAERKGRAKELLDKERRLSAEFKSKVGTEEGKKVAKEWLEVQNDIMREFGSYPNTVSASTGTSKKLGEGYLTDDGRRKFKEAHITGWEDGKKGKLDNYSWYHEEEAVREGYRRGWHNAREAYPSKKLGEGYVTSWENLKTIGGHDINKIAKAAYPSYKGRTISVWTSIPSQLDSYWDEGYRTYYTFYELATGRTQAVGSNHPMFESHKPRYLSELPKGVVIVARNYMGSKQSISIYANASDIEATSHPTGGLDEVKKNFTSHPQQSPQLDKPSPFSTKPSTPEEHKIKIAKDTLKMPDAMAGVMGGPTKEEARRTLFPTAKEEVAKIEKDTEKIKQATEEIKQLGGGVFSTKERGGSRPIFEIAQEIAKDWGKVYFGAVPYLNAMHSLKSIDDSYGLDSGSSVIAYFLANANTWKGEKARQIKKELQAMLKQSYKKSLEDDVLDRLIKSESRVKSYTRNVNGKIINVKEHQRYRLRGMLDFIKKHKENGAGRGATLRKLQDRFGLSSELAHRVYRLAGALGSSLFRPSFPIK